MAEKIVLDRATERLFKALSVGYITIVAFESLAVTTAMPTITTDLAGHNLYALAMGVVLATQLMTTALAGPWSDTKGPHSCLYTGVALVTIGLLICTFAPTMPIFVIGRAVEGLGAGLTIVPLYTMVGNTVAPDRQPAFFTAFAAAWVLPSLFGPALAGFIVQHFSWRWVFGIAPVITIVALPIFIRGMQSVPDIERENSNLRLGRTAVPSILAGVSIATLQVMSGTEKADFTWTVGITIAISAIATFLFASALLPGGTFIGRRGLPATVLTRMFINGCFVSIEMFLPLQLQEVHGWTPIEAGLILSVGSITWAIGSWISGRFHDPHLRSRLPFWGTLTGFIGLWAVVIGCLETVSGLVVIAGWFVTGLGIGLAYPALTVHALAISSLENQGRASSALQIADTMGGAVGAAILGIAYALFSPPVDIALFTGFAIITLLCGVGVLTAARISPQRGSRAAERIATADSDPEEEGPMVPPLDRHGHERRIARIRDRLRRK
ncbi:Predicted arabinose efflux permease, MFS family [Actinobaculum suis]|uniref:Predicted arabinose efflux permease, MFS family n=1 Tax=Actinobaculum suis TaxID=1657 RepID=A0A1G7C6B6_9ACTO|nr:MFS transporter [Actinobaculum suis]SDE33985.1 Predicted arabinose efflux permease, MFS family [Actinobaculum suis]